MKADFYVTRPWPPRSKQLAASKPNSTATRTSRIRRQSRPQICAWGQRQPPIRQRGCQRERERTGGCSHARLRLVLSVQAPCLLQLTERPRTAGEKKAYFGCTFGSPPGVPGGGMTLR